MTVFWEEEDGTRWAEEPVTEDTLRRFVPVPNVPKKELNNGGWASLWRRKPLKSEGN